MTWTDMLRHEPVPRGVGDDIKCKTCEGPIENNEMHGADEYRGQPELINMRVEWFTAQRSLRESMRALARLRTPEYPQGVRIEGQTIEYERLKWQVEALLSGILEPNQRFDIENEFMVKQAEHLKGTLDRVSAPAAQLSTPGGKRLFVAREGWTPPHGQT
jgi:hypothetical protein